MIAQELDEYVDRYEAALIAGQASPRDLARFLPDLNGENQTELIV
jgi:hypothetical protein